MTNEQLAILLSSYSKRLKTIIDNVDFALPAEAERAHEWWHGEERLSNISYYWGRDQEELESKGYELRPTGRALVLGKAREFISDLLKDAFLLRDASRASVSKRTKCL